MSDEIDLSTLSDEEIENLANDLTKDEPAESTSESAPEAPKVTQYDEDVQEDEQADVSEEPEQKRGNLNVALQKERDRRRDAEATVRQLTELLSQNSRKAPEPEPELEEEIAPDPFLDPENYVKYELEKRDRQYRQEIESLRQKQVAADIRRSEQGLKQSGELEEYYELVNLKDANHPFAKLVNNTPGLMDRILNHDDPARYALEIARNQQIALNPEYATKKTEQLREQIRKEERDKLLKELLNKSRGPVKGPRSVASLSSNATGTSKATKDYRQMSDAELEAAAFE
jgi:hypothetical protein